jgi:multidrug efflux pump subunit AcrB
MERLVRFFVERHVVVNVITLAIVGMGVFSALRTNVEGMPIVSLPRFSVTAVLPGASARDVETKVTIPIEDELRDIDGLDNYTTVVTDNRSVTLIELDDDTPDKALLAKEREIRNAIESITDFPEDMKDEPTIDLMDPSKMPVVEIAVSGEKQKLPGAARQIERALLRSEGVAEVTIVGMPDPELRVLVDPAALRAHRVTLLEIVRAIERRNVSDTGGVLESADSRRQVVMWGRFRDPYEAGDVILRFDEDGPLRVRDVARLELDREDVGLLAGTNGEPGLSLIITKQPTADMIRTREAIRRAVETVELPSGVTTAVVNDRSFEMANRISILATNGAMGLALVATIVFLFLAPSAAMWVCVGVPVVILAVVAVTGHVGRRRRGRRREDPAAPSGGAGAR